jgi:hypothetical protein
MNQQTEQRTPLMGAAIAEARAEDALYTVAKRIDALATTRIDDALKAVADAADRMRSRIAAAIATANETLAGLGRDVTLAMTGIENQLHETDCFTGDFAQDEYRPYEPMTAEEWDGAARRAKHAPYHFVPLAIAPTVQQAAVPARTPAPSICVLSDEEVEALEAEDTVIEHPGEEYPGYVQSYVDAADAASNQTENDQQPDASAYADARQLDDDRETVHPGDERYYQHVNAYVEPPAAVPPPTPRDSRRKPKKGGRR